MILLASKGTPQKFENLGSGRLETTDIHLSDTFIQTELPEVDSATDTQGYTMRPGVPANE